MNQIKKVKMAVFYRNRIGMHITYVTDVSHGFNFLNKILTGLRLTIGKQEY